MRSLGRLFSSPTVRYPLATIAILGIVCFWLYTSAIRQSRSALNERAFHELGVIANQFAKRVSNYLQIVNYSLAGDVVKAQFPELLEVTVSGKPAAPRVSLEVSAAELNIRLSYKADGRPVRYDAPLGKVLSPFVAQFPWDLFQEIFLADGDGKVLYQTSRSGLVITNLRAGVLAALKREKEQGPDQAARKNANAAGTQPDQLDQMFAVTRVTAAELAGEKYQLYSLPLALHLDNGENVVIGGLMSENAFHRAQSAPLGNTVLTMGLVLLLVVFASYPLLRYTMLSKTDHVRRGALYASGLQMIVTGILLAGAFGHFFYLNNDTRTDKKLKLLADAIEDHLVDEVRDALVELDTLNSQPAFARVLENADPNPTTGCIDPAAEAKGYAKGNILEGQSSQHRYPYFDHAFWTNKSFYQVVKWSTGSELKRVCVNSRFTVHNAIDKRNLWTFSDSQATRLNERELTEKVTSTLHTDPRQQFFSIEADYSATAAQYVAFIGQPFEKSSRLGVKAAVIVSPLLSLSDPVLPSGYAFALVQRDGLVLFHSTVSKNGQENFFDACRREQQLIDLVTFRQAGSVELPYLGTTQRAYVRPLDGLVGCPWSLVLFRDISDDASDHVKAMEIFLALAGMYVAFLVIVGGMLWTFTRVAPAATEIPGWLWPRAAMRFTYWQLFAILMLVLLLTFWLIRGGSPQQLIVLSFVLPTVTLASTYLKLNRRELWIPILIATVFLALVFVSPGLRNPLSPGGFAGGVWLIAILFSTLSFPIKRSTSQQAGIVRPYSLAAVALLALVSFRPAQALSVAASEFQACMAIRREQLQLAERLDRRSDAIISLYRDRLGWNEAARKRIRKPLNLYDDIKDDETAAHPIFTWPAKLTKGDSVVEDQIEGHLSFIAFQLFNGDSVLPGHLAAGGAHPLSQWQWFRQGPSLVMSRQTKHTADASKALDSAPHYGDDLHVQKIVSPFPKIASLGGSSMTTSGIVLLFAFAFAFAALVAPYFIISSMVARLFGLRLNLKNHKETWTSAADLPGYSQTVLVGLPRSGKTATCRALAEITYIDLVQVVTDERTKALIPEHAAVLLDHFEQCCSNYAANLRVLEFIESFVHRPDLSIIILSTFEPLYFLDFRIAELLHEKAATDGETVDTDSTATIRMDRWVNALAGFHILDSTPSLPQSPRSVPWYRMLWNTCTGGERLALNQLARYGWPNYRQEPALSHLARRGLVEQTTSIRIIDPGFAEFIRESVAPTDYLHWAPQDQVTQWEALRSVFLILAAAAILAALLAFGDKTMAYVTTGVGAVTATTKLLASVKGKGLKGDA